ncbi:MAG: cysteine hydrolase family protein [Chitinophagaceae bacterium]|nr:cysteine hydrolase family protein [Chitinophagaceae bacterium]
MLKLFAVVVLLNFIVTEAFAQQKNTVNNISQLYLTQQWRDSSNQLFSRTEIYNASNMAIVVVDMWDKHWCASMNKKAEGLIPKMNKTFDAARALGIKIIFAHSETTKFYEAYPQRQRMKQSQIPAPLEVNDFNPPPLPWGRTGGCECSADRTCKESSTWTRQHDALIIKDEDLISDRADEINAFCKANGIKTLLYVGEASNMCVTWTRSFSVIPMIRYGYETIVIRDLIESISGNGYDPDKKVYDPSFTPQKGADSTLTHIEKYLCSSISANQILSAAGREPLSKVQPEIKRKKSRNHTPKSSRYASRKNSRRQNSEK